MPEITLTPQLGNAGWGCPDPLDPTGDFLSDGYDTPEDAIAAARAAVAADVETTAVVTPVEITDEHTLTLTTSDLNRIIGALGDRIARLDEAGAVYAADGYRALRSRILDAVQDAPCPDLND